MANYHVSSNCFSSSVDGYISFPAFGYEQPENVGYVINQRSAGTVSKYTINVFENAQTVTTTFRDRKNGSNGSVAISIAGSTTGWFEDNTNTTTIAVNDDTQVYIDISATNVIRAIVSAIWTPTSDQRIYVMSSRTSVNSLSASTTYYNKFIGWQDSLTTTEDNEKVRVKVSGTIKNFTAYIDTESRTTTTTYRLRINGANGNSVLSITGTGLLEDTTNTDTIASGDDLDYSLTTGTGSGTCRAWMTAVQWENSSDEFPIGVGTVGGFTQAFNVTNYQLLTGSSNSTTEANAETRFRTSANLSNLHARITTNSITTSASTIKSRKNQADGNQSLSISASTTGYFEDTTNSDSFADQDEGDTQIVTPNTSGSLVYEFITYKLFYATPQIARPDGDQSVGSWTGEGGETSNLYTHIDESVASDTDYIQSETAPSSSVCQVTLQNVTDPTSSSGHIIRYRYRKNSTASPIDIVVRLKQGTTTIASNTHTGVSTTWTDGSFTLSGAEADSITDYSDLRLEFQANQTSAPSNQIVRPDGDVSAGGWSPSTGTTLFETIDEVTSSDTDYDTTANNPSADAMTVSLGNPTDPIVHTGHTLNYRYGASIGSRVIEIKVALMQGATVIHEATHSAVADGFHDGTFTLTEGEAANITDYSDLRVRVTANTSGGGSPSHGRFAWAELQLPNVGSRGQISWAELEVPSGTSLIAVALTTIFKHNIIQAIPKSTILKHNIRAAISASTIFKHNLRTFAALQTIFKHNLREAVSLQTILKHKIMQAINKETILKHNIREAVSKESIFKHNIRVSVSLSTILKHNIRAAINKETIFKHGIFGSVMKPTIFKHNIREAINKETIMKHNIREAVTQSTIFKHNIRVAVFLQTIFKHNMAGSVAKLTIFKHNIQNTVNKETIFKHNINTNVAKQTIFKHNILQAVTKSTIFKHGIAGAVAVSTIFKHIIRVAINKETILKHNIRVAVQKSTILKHQIRQAISQSTIFKHNIRVAINKGTIFKHNINEAVTNSTIFKHNIREAVSVQTILKHNIRTAASLQTIFKHNILGSNLIQVIKTTIFRHNILGELAGEVDATFPDYQVEAVFENPEVDALFLNTSVTAIFRE